MKLLIVFVHDEDANKAAQALRRGGFRFTTLQSTSGLLRDPSRTFLLGLEEEQVERCLAVFEEHCDQRMVGAPGSLLEGLPVPEEEFSEKYRPITIEVGGAVGFIVEAQRVL